MDPERARELLARERERVEQAIGAVEREGPEEGDSRREPGDEGSEDLYQDEFDAGRVEDLKERLAAVERAKARLEAGTYGLSVQSGAQIPDERLAGARRSVSLGRRDQGDREAVVALAADRLDRGCN